MFKVNEKNQVIRNILNCDYLRYSPTETSTINTPSSQTYINLPREDSINSALDSRVDLKLDVLPTATVNRYENGNDIRLTNFGSIASFSKYDLTSS